MKEFVKQYYTNETYNHVLNVSKRFVYGSDGYYLSLLHDIIEDTEIGYNKLHEFLITVNKEYLLKEVKCITRIKEETYFEYIKRINECENGLCKSVKIADLEFNLSMKQTLKPSLEKRYKKALIILKK